MSRFAAAVVKEVAPLTTRRRSPAMVPRVWGESLFIGRPAATHAGPACPKPHAALNATSALIFNPPRRT